MTLLTTLSLPIFVDLARAVVRLAKLALLLHSGCTCLGTLTHSLLISFYCISICHKNRHGSSVTRKPMKSS